MVKISSQEALNLKPVSLNVKQINVEKESASIWDGQDFGDSIGADSEIDNEEVTKLNKPNGVSQKEGKPSIGLDKAQETKDDGYIERCKKVLDDYKKQADKLFDAWDNLYNKSKALAYEYGYTRDINKYFSEVTEPDLLKLYEDMKQLEKEMESVRSEIEKYEKILENAKNKDSSK